MMMMVAISRYKSLKFDGTDRTLRSVAIRKRNENIKYLSHFMHKSKVQN